MTAQPQIKLTILGLFLLLFWAGCREEKNVEETQPGEESFYFGADLSYVNQILDHGGIYKDQGEARSPYRIFRDHGTNLVRLRLWHNPEWTKDIYGAQGSQLYNDLADVEKAIALAKEQEMGVLLDFQFSDTWADPGKQEIPKAWINIRDLAILKDSVYQYASRTLKRLDALGLMPEMVQLGNEINCGMFNTNPPAGFPRCDACKGEWQQLGESLNAAIRAVRDVSALSSVKTEIVLHVADPKNIEWWFDNISTNGKVSDFDIIGFSYYPLWHTTVPLDQLSENVEKFKSKYKKTIVILETAYPWTTQNNDAYNNIFGSQNPVAGFPFTKEGQFEMIKSITQNLMNGGGSGVIYWEPAWISSEMKDLWGKGSSWENTTLFDFAGNTIVGMDYMKHPYQKN